MKDGSARPRTSLVNEDHGLPRRARRRPASFRDTLKDCQLKLNNSKRFTTVTAMMCPATYFRQLDPYLHHTRVPDAGVYAYSFAITPESNQPSGSANFSRIDNASFKVTPNLKSADGATRRQAPHVRAQLERLPHRLASAVWCGRPKSKKTWVCPKSTWVCPKSTSKKKPNPFPPFFFFLFSHVLPPVRRA